MNISNKIESSKKIKELNLNKFPERIFETVDRDEIENFFRKESC